MLGVVGGANERLRLSGLKRCLSLPTSSNAFIYFCPSQSVVAVIIIARGNNYIRSRFLVPMSGLL